MSNTLYSLLIFDVYNIWYRVTWKNDNLTKIDDKSVPIDAVCKFFELTNNYISKFGTSDCKIFWLFDNAKTTVMKNRKLLDSEYKKARKIQPDWFYEGLNLVELILKFYRNNSYIYRKQGVEADDFVLPIIDTYIKEHDKVILFSTDLDWCRALLDDEIHDIKVVQYTKNNEILTVKSFEDKYGFKPTITNVIFWKTFYGDESDNILPTLNTYPKKYFLDVLNNYTHVDNFIKDVLNGKISYLDGGWRIKIKQLQERMRLNWNLISSADISNNDIDSWKIECSYKPNKLLIIYSTLNVLGRFDDRIKIENKESSIWQMLNGETLNRAD
jgi:hypothetical protein